MWHKAKAVIVYDPPRPGMKSRRVWWAVANVIGGFDICRYFRYQIEKSVTNPLGFTDDINSPKKYPYVKLCEPSWGAHVSIIRGEKPTPELMYLWKKHDGKVVDIEYSHNVKQTGVGDDGRPDNFWVVDVKAPELIAIRTELNRPTDWGLHMTVARTW